MASDKLTVTFDSSPHDEAGICVSRVVDGKVVVLKMELGEQADILYYLLTEQTAKAEIRSKNEVKMTKEEAIERLESIKETYETFAGELDDIHLDVEALEYAIEKLGLEVNTND